MPRTKWLLSILGSVTACGAAAPPPPAAASRPNDAPVARQTGTPSPAASGSSSSRSSAAAAAALAYQDPEEALDPATLTPLVAKEDKPSFPPKSVGERECWQTMTLTGDATLDYRALVEHCGAATGSIEYAKPATGHLDHVQDKRDTFILPIRKGLCYRFFGVADATIPDLDILIERDGALLGSDKTSGSVAIIDQDKSWCMDRDGQFQFQVQVHGEGRGKYVFGAWARPKP